MKQLSLTTGAFVWFAEWTARRQQRLFDHAVQEVKRATSECDTWSRRFKEGVQLYHYDGNTRTPLTPQGTVMSCTEIKAAQERSYQRLKVAHSRYEAVCQKLRNAGWNIE